MTTDNRDLQPSSPQKRPTWPALSQQLDRWLHEGTSSVRDIAANPALLAECRAALPAIRAFATTPASREETMAVLGKRFALYPQPDRSRGEWDEWWADYLGALDGLARPALEAAMGAYVKLPDSEFFPKPGRIRELAKTAPNPAELAYWKANSAVRQADTDTAMLEARAAAAPPSDVAPEPKPDREAVRRMLADYIASHNALKADRPAKPAFKPPQGKVDETGITPEMRDLIGRRQG